jgi:hypothetical protein
LDVEERRVGEEEEEEDGERAERETGAFLGWRWK